MHLVQLGSILAPFLFATPIISFTSVLVGNIIGTIYPICEAANGSTNRQWKNHIYILERQLPAYLTKTDILAYVHFFLKIREPLLNRSLLLSIQEQSFHINIGIRLFCDYSSMSVFLSRLQVT